MDMHNIAAHKAQAGIEILEEHPISFPNKVATSSVPEPINPCVQPNLLRSFEGCEHYSEKEALAISESLFTLAKILLEST
jgi:hypothetical protein